MDGAPFMPDRQIATRDLREHSRNNETVSNREFVNSLLVHQRAVSACTSTPGVQHPVRTITSPRTIIGFGCDPRRENLFPPS